MNEKLQNNEQIQAAQDNKWENMDTRLNVEFSNKYFSFRQAEVFAKKGIVEATQITEEGLENGLYADKDVRYDEESGNYVIDTFVMRDKEDGTRVAEHERTRPVKAGEWIITNPTQQEGDRSNNYAMGDDKFQTKYETTDQDGIYEAKGLIRAFPNTTGRDILAKTENKEMSGDRDCWLAVPYDPSRPFALNLEEGYIVSANDMANYAPAAEIRQDYEPVENYVCAEQIGDSWDKNPGAWDYTCLDIRGGHAHPAHTDWYLQLQGKVTHDNGSDMVMSNEEFLAQYEPMSGEEGNEKVFHRKEVK